MLQIQNAFYLFYSKLTIHIIILLFDSGGGILKSTMTAFVFINIFALGAF